MVPLFWRIALYYRGGGGYSVTISNASVVLQDVHLGDSISCNGICLTVTEFTEDSFKVGISPETIRKTNLGSFRISKLKWLSANV